MSLLTSSIAALNAGLKTTAGVGAAYRRGNQAIDHLVIVPANTRHDEYGDEQTTITARECDWIIWAADLVNAGEQWTPAAGDAIEITGPRGLQTFEVMTREGDRAFRHTDQTRQQLRVYSIERAAVAEP